METGAVTRTRGSLEGLGKAASFWIETAPAAPYPVLSGDVTADVAVLGGGIAGITAAVLLKESGLTVALIEADRILSRVTGHTTAKLTSAHGLIYHQLISGFGKEGAKLYADANQSAIRHVEESSRRRGIDCDLVPADAYTFSETREDSDRIRDEAEAAKSLGLPASCVEEIPGLFKISSAVRFEAQARFHPRKYLLPLAAAIPGDGSYLFERTRAFEVKEGEPCEVVTERGTVRARDVVVATHFPFLLGGEFFMKMYPRQSYVLGLRIEGDVPRDMYYSVSFPYSTVRAHPSGTGAIVLVGGQDHKTGHGGDIIDRYREVEEYARNRFTVSSIDFHWTTQDNVTVDEVPYIGKLTGNSDHVYVATGFKGWGMTSGTVAGILLSDLICGRRNPWADLFDATRSKPLISAKEFLARNIDIAKELAAGKMPSKGDPDALALGQAAVVDAKDGKIACYRDEGGRLHAVSAVCTHLGCTVVWDNAEKSWDCPCHGSRYDYDGNIIYGPATKNLAPKNVERE